MAKIIKYWLPVILWMCLIFYISSYPTAKTSIVQWEDFTVKKFAHVLIYGVLAVLIYRALLGYGESRARAMFISVFFVFLYGASDEFHQSFTPGREPHVRDVLIDTFGSIIAVGFIWKLLPKMPKKLKILAQKLGVY